MNILKTTHNKIKNFLYSMFNDPAQCYTNNPSEEYLFIGGSNDGRFIAIPDNQWKVLLTKDLLNLNVKEVYYKYILYTKNTRLAIYVSSNTPENQILDKLVENYGRK